MNFYSKTFLLFEIFLILFPSQSRLLSQWGSYFYNTPDGHVFRDYNSPDTREFEDTITFDVPFPSTPQVAVVLHGIDTGYSDAMGGAGYVTNISPTGFTLGIRAHPLSKIYAIKLAWMATISPYITITQESFSGFTAGVKQHSFTGLKARTNPGAIVYISEFAIENSTVHYFAQTSVDSVTSTGATINYETSEPAALNNILVVTLIHYQVRDSTYHFTVEGQSTNPNMIGRDPNDEIFQEDNFTMLPSTAERVELIGLAGIGGNQSNIRFNTSYTREDDSLSLAGFTWYRTHISVCRIDAFIDNAGSPTVKFTIS